MSTIKSSDEHLTLNADGSSKDIKFQANGVEKASIDSSGNLTVSGNLTSVGIDDNADATAITINSSEQVGIGTTSPAGTIHAVSSDSYLERNTDNIYPSVLHWRKSRGSLASPTIVQDDDTILRIDADGYNGNDWSRCAQILVEVDGTPSDNDMPARMKFATSADGSESPTTRLELTSDGRGLSQFTAKAWVNFNGTGTVAIRDSHNVSSITDNSTGQYTINFSNNIGNADYCAVANVSVNEDGTSSTIDSDVTLRNYATSSVKFLVYIGQGIGWTDSAICTALIFGD